MSAKGRSDSSHRMQVARVAPDWPVPSLMHRRRVIKGDMSYRSLYGLALWTYEESTAVLLQRVRWKPAPDFPALFGDVSPKTGVIPRGR
jgi:hypothetical protein